MQPSLSDWLNRADKPKKARKPIPKVAKRRNKLNAEYAKKKRAHMKQNPICEFELCTKPSQDLHHRKGRGKYLCDESTFSALCRSHHDFIHSHPSWARENGWLI